MMEEIIQLRKKSKRSLAAAKYLQEKKDFDFAVSRAYYSLFYTVEALLLMKGESYSKHSGVISAFYRSYIANGTLDKKYHQILDSAFDLRNDADYSASETIPPETGKKIILQCEEFIEATEKFFNEKNN